MFSNKVFLFTSVDCTGSCSPLSIAAILYNPSNVYKGPKKSNGLVGVIALRAFHRYLVLPLSRHMVEFHFPTLRTQVKPWDLFQTTF